MADRVRSRPHRAEADETYQCDQCNDDHAFLRSRTRPPYEGDGRGVRVVDLFSGCGGLSLGLAEAARRLRLTTRIVLAVDIDDAAAATFRRNFPNATVEQSDVVKFFDGALGADATESENAVAARTGEVDILVSGAPCQGHSDLNNHTRRRDPRNALYLRAVRAAEILRPSVVLLENVPAVQHDAGGVVTKAIEALARLGYSVDSGVLRLSDLGVPQSRRRHFVLATANELPSPGLVLRLSPSCAEHLPRSIEWAISDLGDLNDDSGFDAASTASSNNVTRMQWLFENDAYDLPNDQRPKCHQGVHTYTSMYGRLRWDAPAQTITTGFGSMGQGRYVHPGRQRTLTPHEAARLQTFPDFFDFGSSNNRGAWASMIGNAVPPLVTLQLALRVLPHLPWVMQADLDREQKPAQEAELSQPALVMA